MPRKACLYLLALYLIWVSAANAESVGDLLNRNYNKQILALRYPVIHGEENFDSSGKPLDTPSAEDWLVYGGIYVHSVKLSRDRLLVEGPRVAIGGRYEKHTPGFVPLGKPVKVQVHLDRALETLEEAQALLARIFFFGEESSLHTKPEYRRADYRAPDAADRPIFQIGKDGVKAPIPVYTPPPAFSEEARQGRYHATVLLDVTMDERGTINRIRIERAVGLGLDQNAVDTVKTWRFKPATRDGQPVPIEMLIEVAFNLF
jgi:TonB family protein